MEFIGFRGGGGFRVWVGFGFGVERLGLGLLGVHLTYGMINEACDEWIYAQEAMSQYAKLELCTHRSIH